MVVTHHLTVIGHKADVSVLAQSILDQGIEKSVDLLIDVAHMPVIARSSAVEHPWVHPRNRSIWSTTRVRIEDLRPITNRHRRHIRIHVLLERPGRRIVRRMGGTKREE